MRLEALGHQPAAVEAHALLGLRFGGHGREAIRLLYVAELMSHRLDGDFDGTFPYAAGFVQSDSVRLHYVDEGPRGRPARAASSTATPPGATSGATSCAISPRPDTAAWRSTTWASDARTSLRTCRRTRCAAHIDNALAVIDSLDLRDVVLVVHDWGGPIGLGAMLERVERLRGLVIMNTWAWELPSFLPPFVREFRNEGLGEILALGGNLFVESIPGGMAQTRHGPADDGRLPRALPGLLVARRHARVPARHPADRARPQRAA